MKRMLFGMLVVAAVAAQGEMDWERLDAEARKHAKTPIRAGVPGTRPFWNAHAKAFIHPPAFEFKEVAGVKEYRCRIESARGPSNAVKRTENWTAAKPWHPIPADIWDSLKPGYYTVKVEGVGERTFYRAAVFRGPYLKGTCDYRTAAQRVYAAVYNLPQVQGWKTSDDPPKGYDLYCYPAKIMSSMIRALVRHAKEADAADALAIARKMADWLIAHSQPASAPLAHFPPTYWGDRRDVAVRYAGQNMLGYPAHAANAYLDLAEATGEAKYRAAAIAIARTFMKLQGEDGTWPLKVLEKDGSPVRANRLVPSRYLLGMFDRAFAATGDAAFATARNKAFAYVLNGPMKTWNWDGQFEDMDPMPPYKNLQKGCAVDTALRLFALGCVAEGCELVDWCEDQFVVWSAPIHNMDWKNWKTPTALEQYDYYTPIDASMGDMIGAFATAYKATKNRLYLEKAKALADNITRHQRADGTIPTYFDSRRGSDWVNCMIYVADRLEALAEVIETVPASTMPWPAFSFKYGDRTVTGSESMQVDAHLKVTVESVVYPQFNAVEWVLWFENPSAEKSAVLSEIRDGSFLVSLPPQPKKFSGDIALPGERAVVTMNGCVSGIDYSTSDVASAREFAAITRYFHPWRGKGNVFELSNGCARSSDRQAPFFEVTQGGQGAIVAIGWTGGWRARFVDSAEGVRVETGIARARFYLEPGEKLRTSRVLVMNYAKGEDGANKFRRLLRRHFSHVASRPGIREGLFAYELWGGLTSAEMIRRVNTLKAKGLAYEDLWIDAGWYGNSKKCDDAYTGDWGAWTGDWTPNVRIHPKGLTDVRDAAKNAGMGIMLWFEPERVVGSSNFAKEHPDLLLGPLLYYGNEKGRNYVRDLLADFAGRLNFSCYRQDFNFDPGLVMKDHDAKDREGITQIRHVTGLYQLWDELLERCPKLLIDNCASGGRRIDIETMRRSIPFFRSDYQCAFNANADVLQAHNAGISRLIPYNGCTVKLSDAYSLRSAYSASHGVAYWNAIFQKEEKVDWAAAKKCCDEYRRIRKYFPCDFYNHGSEILDPSAWAIWQYNDPEKKEGVVLAFRRAESPSNRVRVVLKGLPKGAMVEVENLDSGVKATMTRDLEIVLPKPRSSTVLLYCVRD